ncbi:MAG: hypothetical protein RJA61_24 [Candidatus Parcubacteria bacterium]|jgi:FKBP-type peptidyl-prolyl cis-trans isomerase
MLTKSQWIGVVVAIVLVFIFFGFDSIFSSLIWSDDKSDASLLENNNQNTMLGIEDVVVGTGLEAVAGKVVSVHYTGTFTNGVKFDSSVDRGQPIQFVLGVGYVIKGWDQGLVGMKVGGKRKLTIPAELAYGAAGQGPIPPNSTLLFDVELVDVMDVPENQ